MALLNIGLTGLYAAQAQLSTTSHNITNAATPGYHRQSVIQGTQDPALLGGLFFGRGTEVNSVARSYSQFLETQLMLTDTKRMEYGAYNQQISQIDNLLADPNSGMSPAMAQFFAAVQDVAANPSNIASRQAMLSNAESLVGRFRMLDNRMNEIRQGVEYDIEASVETINGYARQIADLNQQIITTQALAGGSPANDLLDMRQQAVMELNQLIKVSTVPQADGSLAVFIGSGQSLVLGANVMTLGAIPSQNEANRQLITLVDDRGVVTEIPERLLDGGSLGGLLAFRREGLDPTQRSLGLIATAFATAFNNQHKLGMDLDGILGGDFFRLGPVDVQPPGAAGLEIDPDRVGELTADNYSLSLDGGVYTMTNLTTGTSAEVTVGDVFEGLRVTSLDMAAGDRPAYIQPMRYAAGGIATAIADPRKIAAADPVGGSVASTNTGSASISELRMVDTTGLAALPEVDFPPLSVTLDSDGAGNFTLTPSDTSYSFSPATYNPATEGTGKVFTVTSADGYIFEFKLSGTPADTDRIDFAPNVGGVADNRNATRLGALQTEKLLFSAGGQPTATLNNAYAQLVSRVGNKTREVQAGEKAQTALYAEAKKAHDSFSGVNLDEEAANLIRYQMAYQASGRVMSVAQRLFDEIVSIGR